jgi:hypothetical protein
VAAFVMVAALRWIATISVAIPPTAAARAWNLAGLLGIGALVFLAVARLLGVKELDLAFASIVAKFQRHLPAPGESRDAPVG